MKRRLIVATPLLLAAALGAQRWAGALLPAARQSAHDSADPAANEAGRDALQGLDASLVRVAATAFGTTVSMAAVPPPGDGGGRATRAALRAAMAQVQDIDAQLSLFRPDSPLSILNRTGTLDGAQPHVLRNLAFARELGERTRGAFDITVQPLWELFSRAHQAGKLPTPAAIAAARRLVDYRAVRIDGSRVRLATPGTRITLNGQAQGYAVDVVLATLRERGVEAVLIDTGEIGSRGGRDSTHPWTVGVRHPRDPASCIAVLTMDGRVVSTSGDYATSFSGDFRYHHIFDPATGVSPIEYASTIVLAPSGLVADGLSTALMVLDREAGGRLVQAYAGASALWIDKNARLQATPGVPFAG